MAADDYRDDVAAVAMHRGEEVEAGRLRKSGLDAVDAVDGAEEVVVIAHRLAVIDEGRRWRSSCNSAESGPGSRGRAAPGRARW